MKIGQQFTLVISYSHPCDIKDAKKHRSDLFKDFKCKIKGHLPRNMTADEKEMYFEEDLKLRSIQREDCVYQEFNVKVRKYPERDVMDVTDLVTCEFRHLIHEDTRAGLLIELCGYQS